MLVFLIYFNDTCIYNRFNTIGLFLNKNSIADLKPMKNPFISTIRTKQIKSTEHLNSDSDSDNVVSIELHTNKTTDIGGYVKLYNDFLPILIELSSGATAIIHHIIKTLKYEDDIVEIPPTLFTSIRSKHNIIPELKRANIIAHITKDKYYINPNYIFRGNRLKYISKQSNNKE